MVQALGKEGQQIEISCFFEELPLPAIGPVGLTAQFRGARLTDDLVGCATGLGCPARLYSDRDPRQPYGHDQIRQRERPGVSSSLWRASSVD